MKISKGELLYINVLLICLGIFIKSLLPLNSIIMFIIKAIVILEFPINLAGYIRIVFNSNNETDIFEQALKIIISVITILLLDLF